MMKSCSKTLALKKIIRKNKLFITIQMNKIIINFSIIN